MKHANKIIGFCNLIDIFQWHRKCKGQIGRAFNERKHSKFLYSNSIKHKTFLIFEAPAFDPGNLPPL